MNYQDKIFNDRLTDNQLTKLERDKNFEEIIMDIAVGYEPTTSLGIEELIKAGELGLKEPRKKFKIKKHYKFYIYAYWWIRQGMTQAIDTHFIYGDKKNLEK
tara:strand:- start:43 stop:348 length:306 start_codon:yes stop_codon:yes gene_type:complete